MVKKYYYKKNNICIAFFLTWLFSFNQISAQENDTIPLITFFKQVEHTFQVKFSYSVAETSTIKILNKDFDTLPEALDYLTNVTLFNYEILDNRYILVISKAKNKEAIPLSEVVITDYIIKGISKNKDGSFAIDAKNMGQLPGLVAQDILQITQALPGIESANETISNINIRGGTHDQNLILWNGIKMYHTGHFFGLLSIFNPNTTNKVTIIKNGAPVKYGDAVSGIISMQSELDSTKTVSGGIDLNMLSSDAYIAYSKNKLSFQLAGRRAITDIVESPVLNAYLKRTLENSTLENSGTAVEETDKNFMFYDYNGTFNYAFSPKHSLRLDFINAYNNLNYNQYTADGIRKNDLKQTSRGARLSWNNLWKNTYKTQVELYYSYYDLYGKNTEPTNQQTLIQENNVLETGIKAAVATALTKNITFSTGYQFTETGVRNNVSVNLPYYEKRIKEVMRTHAFYAESTYKKNNWFARAGIRTSYFNKPNKITFEPRINLNTYISPTISLKLQGEVRSQTTNQVIELQTDFFGIEKRRWMLSNGGTIPVSIAKQIAIGADVKKNNWLFSSEIFYKKVTGISTSTQGFQNQNEFVNAIGAYNVAGIEVLVNKQFNRLNSWISYTYSKNEYTFNTLTPPNFPSNYDIRHSFDAGITFTYNKFMIAAGIKYRTGQPYTTPQQNNEVDLNTYPPGINYNKPNNLRLPDYMRADISAGYTFFTSKNYTAQLKIALLNLFNRKNILNQYYEVDTNNQITKVTNYSLGFVPNASLKITF